MTTELVDKRDTMNTTWWDGFNDKGVAVARPEFLKKWNSYLHRIWEPSERHWHGETPLGRMEWLDPCKKVLDIGCGAGYALKELQGKGKEVCGIDITQENGLWANERLSLGLTIGDMHDLPFDDNSFDGVLIWDAFEHSFAPMIVLWEIYRVLQPGGRLLMYLPPDTWMEHRVHMLIPTRQQMEEMLRKSALKLESVGSDPSNGMLLFISK